MSRLFSNPIIRTAVAATCVVLMPWAGLMALADTYSAVPPAQDAPQAEALPQDQLTTLVAPIALYPDPLLGEILAASTYPLEIVEAQQWLGQNPNLRGAALMDAAKQQNWDPSVQVLTGFPDAMSLLTRDIRWTTDLGNAFLNQQADVMNAIQTMRAEAEANGKLASTPQQAVGAQTQNGQSAITIQPTNPQVIYVPVYNPAYVWGPPVWGAYPALGYPPLGYTGPYGYGGYGFGVGINIGGLFSGLIGWGAWGWTLGWFTHSLSLAGAFFNLVFGGAFHGGRYGGGYSAWSHDPVHRLGVPYANAGVAARYRGSFGRAAAVPGASVASRMNSSGNFGAARAARPGADGWQRFGSGAAASRTAVRAGEAGFAPRGAASGAYGAPRTQSFAERSPSHGSFVPGSSAPHYSTPPMASQKYSAPRMSSQQYSAPHYSAPKMSSSKAPSIKAPKNGGGGHSAKSPKKH